MTLTNTRKNPNIGERGGTTMIIELIKRKVPPGTTIPKPQSKKVYLVIGWKNNRQGEEVLEYSIPTKSGTGKRSRKKIPSSVFEAAYETLCGRPNYEGLVCKHFSESGCGRGLQLHGFGRYL
jgi:hypothetical protein